MEVKNGLCSIRRGVAIWMVLTGVGIVSIGCGGGEPNHAVLDGKLDTILVEMRQTNALVGTVKVDLTAHNAGMSTPIPDPDPRGKAKGIIEDPVGVIENQLVLVYHDSNQNGLLDIGEDEEIGFGHTDSNGEYEVAWWDEHLPIKYFVVCHDCQMSGANSNTVSMDCVDYTCYKEDVDFATQ